MLREKFSDPGLREPADRMYTLRRRLDVPRGYIVISADLPECDEAINVGAFSPLKAAHLAYALRDQLLPFGDWRFAWDHAKQRAGSTQFDSRLITLSRHLAPRFTMEEVEQTLLHEVAHAIVGHGHGHNAVWQATANSLGYRGSRTLDSVDTSDLAPYLGVCPRGHTTARHRRPRQLTSCARCCPVFDERFIIQWHRRTPI